MSDNEIIITEEQMDLIRKDCQIDERDLINNLRDCPNKVQKYLEVYYMQNRKLKKLEAYVEQIECELFRTIKVAGIDGIRFTSSTDVMRIAHQDPKYITARKYCDEQKTVVEFYRSVVKNTEQRRYDIKGIIDVKKLDESGY